jgi:beta-mannosidase
MVSGLPDPRSGQADIYVTSDYQKDVSGELLWSVTNVTGELLREGTKQVDIPACTSRIAQVLDLSDLITLHGAENLLIWTEVVIDGRIVANNTLFFGPPRNLKLKKPNLDVKITGGESQYRVVIETDLPALWVWADMQNTVASYSDNFFHLLRKRAVEIEVVLDQPMAPFDFKHRLEIRSVYDVAPEIRACG